MELLFRCFSKTTTEVDCGVDGRGTQALSAVRFYPPVTPHGVEAFDMRMTDAMAKMFVVGEEYRFSIAAEAKS